MSAATPPSSLSVMTFNLRFASPKPPQAWPERLPVVAELIRQEAPDAIGTQEGLYGQLRDMEAALPEYRWIGTGRDGGSSGEFMAIFYRPQRLEPLAFDHFWLSETPDNIGSATWGNTNRRMVTSVHFREKASGKEVAFWDTHFDFADPFHANAGNLVLSRVRRESPNLPVILVGDFNAPAEDKTPAAPLASEEFGLYRLLTGADAFHDAYADALEKRGPQGIATFHGYNGEQPGARIDWILLRGPVAVESAAIIPYRAANGQYPSDHFPVSARLTFTE